MLKIESYRNESSIVIIPENINSLQQDFKKVYENIQSGEKIPFHEIYVFIPQNITELFFEFLNKVNLKPIFFKKQVFLNLFKF